MSVFVCEIEKKKKRKQEKEKNLSHSATVFLHRATLP